MSRIVIIGKGSIGNAIAHILRSTKSGIVFWDTAPGKSSDKHPLAKIIPKADFVFLSVPSFAVPDAILEIKPYLVRRTIIISVSKGIEKKSGATMDELFRRLVPGSLYALLSGPMLAGELLRSMGGAAVVASKNNAVRNAVARLFKNTELRIALSVDVRGVACAGVLKNIYAIVLGAADGMGFGYNAKGFLLGIAESEIAGILPLLGGTRETAGIPALMGDIFATGMSPDSSNHQLGIVLACKNSSKKSLAGFSKKFPHGSTFTEGATSLPFIMKRLGGRTQRFPLLMIADVLARRPKEGKEKLKKFIFS